VFIVTERLCVSGYELWATAALKPGDRIKSAKNSVTHRKRAARQSRRQWPSKSVKSKNDLRSRAHKSERERDS